MTIKQWLDTLPWGMRKSARRQMTNLLNGPKRRLSDAILSFAVWEWTEEGEEFWDSFHKALEWAETMDSITGKK